MGGIRLRKFPREKIRLRKWVKIIAQIGLKRKGRFAQEKRTHVTRHEETILSRFTRLRVCECLASVHCYQPLLADTEETRKAQIFHSFML